MTHHANRQGSRKLCGSNVMNVEDPDLLDLFLLSQLNFIFILNSLRHNIALCPYVMRQNGPSFSLLYFNNFNIIIMDTEWILS